MTGSSDLCIHHMGCRGCAPEERKDHKQWRSSSPTEDKVSADRALGEPHMQKPSNDISEH